MTVNYDKAPYYGDHRSTTTSCITIGDKLSYTSSKKLTSLVKNPKLAVL